MLRLHSFFSFPDGWAFVLNGGDSLPVGFFQKQAYFQGKSPYKEKNKLSQADTLVGFIFLLYLRREFFKFTSNILYSN